MYLNCQILNNKRKTYAVSLDFRFCQAHRYAVRKAKTCQYDIKIQFVVAPALHWQQEDGTRNVNSPCTALNNLHSQWISLKSMDQNNLCVCRLLLYSLARSLTDGPFGLSISMHSRIVLVQ